MISMRAALMALLSFAGPALHTNQPPIQQQFSMQQFLNLYLIGIVATPLIIKGAQILKNIGKQNVGVVTIAGTITSAEETVKQLRVFFEDSSITAIILTIDSGGGAAGSSQAIYNAIVELKQSYHKPVVAWVENIAASGAYYIAAAADQIIASPSAIVGSIGVITQIPQIAELLKKYGIEQKIITAGSYKATSQPMNSMTSEQEHMIQTMCTSVYTRFTGDIATARNLQEPLSVWADGQIFDADRAVTLGLIDTVGSIITVEATIKKLTNNTRSILFVRPPEPSPFQQFFSPKTIAAGLTSIVDMLYTKIEERMRCAEKLQTNLFS